eukprot:1470267-Pyramimonas_sp.AAC.2
MPHRWPGAGGRSRRTHGALRFCAPTLRRASTVLSDRRPKHYGRAGCEALSPQLAAEALSSGSSGEYERVPAQSIRSLRRAPKSNGSALSR